MGLRFDPRTKVICILLTVICTIFMKSLTQEVYLVILICSFGALNGRIEKSIVLCSLFVVAYFAWNIMIIKSVGTYQPTVLAWLCLVFKLFPCCVISGIAIKTTKTNEFLTAMNQSHIPKQLVIPLAVLLRYSPTVREDWGYIKDAMKFRGVSPTIANFIMHPITTVECLYVPLLITASKTADELCIASVTRGIENPYQRTSIREVKFRVYDYMTIVAFIIITIIIIISGVNL